MRIRLLAALLPLALLLWGALGLAAPPLRLVSDVWPPFTDVRGKPREALDLVEAALRRGGRESRSSIMTWSTAVTALKQGKLDGSAAIWKTPQREEFLIFSEPYLENRLVLVARKGDDVSATSIAQLAGKRLALTKDYAYGDAVLKAPNVELVYGDSDAECLRAVLAKQADYLLLDELMVTHLFDHYGTKAKQLIVAGQTTIVKRPLYFALRKDYPGAREIVTDFNRDIKRMIADGSYNTMLHVPWIRADIDGDGTPDYVASRRTLPKGSPDPSGTHGGYPVFNPDPHVANPTRSPAYMIDGKSYDNWGDAATTLQRSGPIPPEGVYKYATGVVLFTF